VDKNSLEICSSLPYSITRLQSKTKSSPTLRPVLDGSFRLHRFTSSRSCPTQRLSHVPSCSDPLQYSDCLKSRHYIRSLGGPLITHNWILFLLAQGPIAPSRELLKNMVSRPATVLPVGGLFPLFSKTPRNMALLPVRLGVVLSLWRGSPKKERLLWQAFPWLLVRSSPQRGLAKYCTSDTLYKEPMEDLIHTSLDCQGGTATTVAMKSIPQPSIAPQRNSTFAAIQGKDTLDSLGPSLRFR
jgi:hypothetical protein